MPEYPVTWSGRRDGDFKICDLRVGYAGARTAYEYTRIITQSRSAAIKLLQTAEPILDEDWSRVTSTENLLDGIRLWWR